MSYYGEHSGRGVGTPSYHGEYHGNRGVGTPSYHGHHGQHHGHRGVSPAPSPSGARPARVPKNPELEALRASDPALFDELYRPAVEHARKITHAALADYSEGQRGLGAVPDIVSDTSFKKHLPTAVTLAQELMQIPAVANNSQFLAPLLERTLVLAVDTANTYRKMGDLGDDDAAREMLEALAANADERGFFTNAAASLTNVAVGLDNAAANAYASARQKGQAFSQAASGLASSVGQGLTNAYYDSGVATMAQNAKYAVKQGMADASYVAKQAGSYARSKAANAAHAAGAYLLNTGDSLSATRDFDDGEDRGEGRGGFFQNLLQFIIPKLAPMIIKCAKKLITTRRGRSTLDFPVSRVIGATLARVGAQVGKTYVLPALKVGAVGVVGGMTAQFGADIHATYIRPTVFPSQVSGPSVTNNYNNTTNNTTNNSTNNSNYSVFPKQRSVMFTSIAEAVTADMIAQQSAPQGHRGLGAGQEKSSEGIAANIPLVIEMAEQHYRQKQALGTTRETEGQYLQRVLSTAVPALIEEERYGGGERGLLGFLAKIIF